MAWWQIALIVALVVLVLAGVVISLQARSLDRVHKNVTKSRIALERALVERAKAALHVARSGVLDAASSVVLAGVATEALEASANPIVNDGWEDIRVEDSEGKALTPGLDAPDRLVIESELSRALCHSVDQLDTASPELDRLTNARIAVQMTRRFHNNHVSQARRLRKSVLVRMLRLQGSAPEPITVNLDDRMNRAERGNGE
ncbi:hypothetical protein [Trueperella bialowiezensis]|uniref:LemA family n=1 Tax=Trueperella bialowiezensis TaxID=312285 RepID=A0A448PC60_9ACTO|nr:hypothetical protein [Trueperella bialowiezensis]VEI12486.1 Uncharacterised protein [Trueperella bialowiezensis]